MNTGIIKPETIGGDGGVPAPRRFCLTGGGPAIPEQQHLSVEASVDTGEVAHV